MANATVRYFDSNLVRAQLWKLVLSRLQMKAILHGLHGRKSLDLLGNIVGLRHDMNGMLKKQGGREMSKGYLERYERIELLKKMTLILWILIGLGGRD